MSTVIDEFEITVDFGMTGTGEFDTSQGTQKLPATKGEEQTPPPSKTNIQNSPT
jgi:hypothetical protein